MTQKSPCPSLLALLIVAQTLRTGLATFSCALENAVLLLFKISPQRRRTVYTRTGSLHEGTHELTNLLLPWHW